MPSAVNHSHCGAGGLGTRATKRENAKTFSRYVRNLFRKPTPFTVHRCMARELVDILGARPTSAVLSQASRAYTFGNLNLRTRMGPHCAPDLPERGATRSRQRAACMRHEITDEQEGPHGPMTRCGQAASARCHITPRGQQCSRAARHRAEPTSTRLTSLTRARARRPERQPRA